MAIRSIKPPQGWRALRWEIAVVVVGVLIALAAQQLVDDLYWKGQAAKARKTIEEELLEHERDAYERQAVTPCLRNQLLRLSARLVADRRSWEPMPMVVYPSKDIPTLAEKVTPTAYRAPTRLWIDEAFRTAQSTGALNHLPADLVATYAAIYRRSRRTIEMQDIEEEAANRLSVLAVRGELSQDARQALFGSLARTDYASSYMEVNLKSQIKLLAEAFDGRYIERRRKMIDDAIRSQREFRGPCVLPLKLQA